MKKRTLLSSLALILALTFVFAIASVALADQGGIPNEKAVNGTAHADERSALPIGDDVPPGGN